MLRRTSGMVFVASEQLGCSYLTMRRRIEKSPRLQRVKEQAEGYLVDIGELKLKEAVLAGNLPAIKYLLSTKGKNRGYVERQETSGADGGPVELLIKVIRE